MDARHFTRIYRLCPESEEKRRDGERERTEEGERMKEKADLPHFNPLLQFIKGLKISRTAHQRFPKPIEVFRLLLSDQLTNTYSGREG